MISIVETSTLLYWFNDFGSGDGFSSLSRLDFWHRAEEDTPPRPSQRSLNKPEKIAERGARALAHHRVRGSRDHRLLRRTRDEESSCRCRLTVGGDLHR